MPRIRIVLIVVPAVLVAAAALAQTPAGHAVLRETGLEQVPASYAALSFAQPQTLPTQLVGPHATVHVPFTIQNHSATTQRYQWSLNAAKAGGPASADTRPVIGSTTVAPGVAATMNPALRINCTGGQVRVTIRLARPAESIYFLADCPAATK